MVPTPPRPNDTPPADRALALLAAYHACIRDLLVHLEDLVAEGRRGGSDREAVARDFLTGFDDVLGVHLGDEEDDVFPAILAASDSPARRAQAFELVSSLLVEHREMAALWTALRAALVAPGGASSPPLPDVTMRRFIDLCRRHVAREERELSDLARRIPAGRLEQVVESMTRRHARTPDGHPCGKRRP
jgi:hemerythrin-like domain-containing protein